MEALTFWEGHANVFVGKTVKSVYYLSSEQAKKFGWSHRPLVIEFNDGMIIYSVVNINEDSENGGVLESQDVAGESLTYPTIHTEGV